MVDSGIVRTFDLGSSPPPRLFAMTIDGEFDKPLLQKKLEPLSRGSRCKLACFAGDNGGRRTKDPGKTPNTCAETN